MVVEPLVVKLVVKVEPVEAVIVKLEAVEVMLVELVRKKLVEVCFSYFCFKTKTDKQF